MTLNNAQGRLLSFVERIERLIEEKKAILEQIKDVKTEAKSAGFEPKVINQMIKERSMSDAERQEWNELCELYRAALGMLAGNPMSDAARRRFDDDRDDEPAHSPQQTTEPDVEDMPEPAPRPTEDEARRDGANACRDGQKVTQNPYPYGDALRAAWDEGWCAEAGTDGMDIPEAWRRAPRKKDEEKGDEA